jgi:hypothetical protein
MEMKLEDPMLKENLVREIVNGMWDDADVESFKEFYYPIYQIELMLKDKRRMLWIDSRAAKEITFSDLLSGQLLPFVRILTFTPYSGRCQRQKGHPLISREC